MTKTHVVPVCFFFAVIKCPEPCQCHFVHKRLLGNTKLREHVFKIFSVTAFVCCVSHLHLNHHAKLEVF